MQTLIKSYYYYALTPHPIWESAYIQTPVNSLEGYENKYLRILMFAGRDLHYQAVYLAECKRCKRLFLKKRYKLISQPGIGKLHSCKGKKVRDNKHIFDYLDTYIPDQS